MVSNVNGLRLERGSEECASPVMECRGRGNVGRKPGSNGQENAVGHALALGNTHVQHAGVGLPSEEMPVIDDNSLRFWLITILDGTTFVRVVGEIVGRLEFDQTIPIEPNVNDRLQRANQSAIALPLVCVPLELGRHFESMWGNGEIFPILPSEITAHSDDGESVTSSLSSGPSRMVLEGLCASLLPHLVTLRNHASGRKSSAPGSGSGFEPEHNTGSLPQLIEAIKPPATKGEHKDGRIPVKEEAEPVPSPCVVAIPEPGSGDDESAPLNITAARSQFTQAGERRTWLVGHARGVDAGELDPAPVVKIQAPLKPSLVKSRPPKI